MLAQGVLKHIVYQSFKILQEKKIQTSVHNPANHVNKKKHFTSSQKRIL